MREMALKVLSSPAFWTILIPAGVTIVAWFLNERSKLLWEQHKRKEENYRELLDSLRGFTTQQADLNLRDKFLQQVTLAWMYASDEVIRSAYHFLESTHEGVSLPQEEKKLRAGAFVHAVRTDLLYRKPVQRTVLRPEDYRFIYAKRNTSEQSHGEATSNSASSAESEVSHV